MKLNLDELTHEARTMVSIQPRVEQVLWHLANHMTELRRQIRDLAEVIQDHSALTLPGWAQRRWEELLREAQVEPSLPAVESYAPSYDPLANAMVNDAIAIQTCCVMGEPA